MEEKNNFVLVAGIRRETNEEERVIREFPYDSWYPRLLCKRVELERMSSPLILEDFKGGKTLEEAIIAPRRLLWVSFRPYQPITKLHRVVLGFVYAQNNSVGGEDPSKGRPQHIKGLCGYLRGLLQHVNFPNQV